MPLLKLETHGELRQHHPWANMRARLRLVRPSLTRRHRKTMLVLPLCLPGWSHVMDTACGHLPSLQIPGSGVNQRLIFHLYDSICLFCFNCVYFSVQPAGGSGDNFCYKATPFNHQTPCCSAEAKGCDSCRFRDST